MTRRRTYTATAVRSGRWWAIDVTDVAGCHTQARTVADIEPMARDAVAMLLDVAPGSFDVKVDLRLPDRARKLLDAAARAANEAKAAEAKARKDRAAAVAAMVAAGISQADAGRVLGVSEQRAHQLVAAHAAGRSSRAGHAAARRDVTVDA
jgi:predicted RNase H-like HicB family nuclease